MTKVKINKCDNIIEIKADGHSGYGHTGTDIVCAGISALTYAFCELCFDYARKNMVDVISFGESDGYIGITVRDNHHFTDSAVNMYKTGMAMLENSYPENLCLEWVESA